MNQILNVNNILIFGGFFSGLSLLYLGKIWYSYRFFRKRGIKTPEYEFFHGNFREIRKKRFSEALREWTQKLGKTYGYYEGHYPILVTSDSNMIQEVFIKQFSNFTGRKHVPAQYTDENDQVNVGTASKATWKRHRTILNPTFSPAKLKEIFPLMAVSTDRFIKRLDDNLNQEFDISEVTSKYTMDVLANAVFGMETNMQSDQKNTFFKKANELLNLAVEYGPFVLVNFYFYDLKSIFLPLLELAGSLLEKLGLTDLGNSFFWLQRHLFEIVKKRFNTNISRKDYVNVLIEALSEKNEINDGQSNGEKFEFANLKIEKRLSTNEVTNNLFVFLIAGFDTTATALSTAYYCLCKYPNEMKKIQDEIDSIMEAKNNELNYETVSQLSYLEMFIREVLRIYPVASNFITRKCTHECQINGLTIPVGLVVTVDVLSIHFDPEYWGPNPDEFDPERFRNLSKINNCTYFPFGIGPRTCLGMKFALTELKLALAKILHRYNINSCSQTPEILELIEGFPTRKPRYGVKVLLEKRNN